MHCRRCIASPISRRDILARCANGFGAVALAALLGEKAHGAGMAEFPEDLAKWVKMPPPRRDDRYWSAANWDTEHHWAVFLRGDRPSVRLGGEKRSGDPPLPFAIEPGTAKEGLAGRRVVAKVSDGWIVGFNAGEWGGALWWFSPDGKTRAKISEHQVIKFIETDAGLLAFEGLAHMSTSRGSIIRLSKGKDDLWHSEPFGDLRGAPQAAVKCPDGSLVVATSDRLLRVDPGTRKIEVLVKDAFWGTLYPTSAICTPSGTIYLGMRHGVAEIEKTDTAYKVNWLIPDAEYDRGIEKQP